ncbi:MAG: 4-hydroxy-tetrahydrodipicolinate reductase [Clostridia bacterium]|nr:4-hydroxy-tetrahydrodipicolinate reductase [Clostridia bacterium]
MKVIVIGSNGYMGKEVIALLEKGVMGSSLAAAVDINVPASCNYPTYTSPDDIIEDADVIIDFSHHSITKDVMHFAVSRGIPVVMATTGHSEDEKEYILKASKSIPVFMSANMSLGVALLVELAKNVAKTMPEADIEIVETHHNRKLDAPSGTALLIANAIKEVREKAQLIFGREGKRQSGEIGISAVRRGNIVGIHEVLVSTDSQTITLKHEAHSRALFAEGAISAASFIADKDAGLYNMNDMVGK